MSWVDPVTKDDIFSTTEAAKDVAIHPVTLRRYLFRGVFQAWLANNRKPALRFVRLQGNHKKPHHIWQFGNRDRVNLREFLDDRERAAASVPETRYDRRRLSTGDRKRRMVVRRYAGALAALRGIGIAPENARLVRVAKSRATEVAVLRQVEPDFNRIEHEEWLERMAEKKGLS